MCIFIGSRAGGSVAGVRTGAGAAGLPGVASLPGAWPGLGRANGLDSGGDVVAVTVIVGGAIKAAGPTTVDAASAGGGVAAGGSVRTGETGAGVALVTTSPLAPFEGTPSLLGALRNATITARAPLSTSAAPPIHNALPMERGAPVALPESVRVCTDDDIVVCFCGVDGAGPHEGAGRETVDSRGACPMASANSSAISLADPKR